MNSKKNDKLFFSGKEEDYVYFSDQFEARKFVFEVE